MEESKNNLTPFIIVDIQVLIDRRLNSTDKLVYSLISSLSNNLKMCCYAKNNYLSKIIGIDARNIQRALKKLKDCGYIKITIENYNNRIITPTINQYLQRARRSIEENYIPIDPEILNYDWLNEQNY